MVAFIKNCFLFYSIFQCWVFTVPAMLSLTSWWNTAPPSSAFITTISSRCYNSCNIFFSSYVSLDFMYSCSLDFSYSILLEVFCKYYYCMMGGFRYISVLNLFKFFYFSFPFVCSKVRCEFQFSVKLCNIFIKSFFIIFVLIRYKIEA